MIVEARIAFLVFFFFIWCILGLIPWAVAAVITRGRGALPALPLALFGACAAGVLVPVLGARDAVGLLLSMIAAPLGGVLGSLAGIAFSRRLEAEREAGVPLTSPPGERTVPVEAAGSTPERPVR